MNLKPLGDRVIVKQDEAEETTASGLFLATEAKEKPQSGTVLAVGEGKLDKLIGVLGLRVAACLALSLAAFFLLPYDYLTRCVIATVIWAPMSALAPLYTLWCGGDHGLAGLAGTISIVLGIAAMLCVITCSGVL